MSLSERLHSLGKILFWEDRSESRKTAGLQTVHRQEPPGGKGKGSEIIFRCENMENILSIDHFSLRLVKD